MASDKIVRPEISMALVNGKLLVNIPMPSELEPTLEMLNGMKTFKRQSTKFLVELHGTLYSFEQKWGRGVDFSALRRITEEIERRGYVFDKSLRVWAKRDPEPKKH